VDDIGSFDPERTVVRWLDVQVDGKPLSVEGKLGAVVKVAIPPGERPGRPGARVGRFGQAERHQ
jgi:hypothetical protein